MTAVSTDVDGHPSITANQHNYVRATSADGRFVAFRNRAGDLNNRTDFSRAPTSCSPTASRAGTSCTGRAPRPEGDPGEHRSG